MIQLALDCAQQRGINKADHSSCIWGVTPTGMKLSVPGCFENKLRPSQRAGEFSVIESRCCCELLPVTFLPAVVSNRENCPVQPVFHEGRRGKTLQVSVNNQKGSSFPGSSASCRGERKLSEKKPVTRSCSKILSPKTRSVVSKVRVAPTTTMRVFSQGCGFFKSDWERKCEYSRHIYAPRATFNHRKRKEDRPDQHETAPLKGRI